MGVLAFLAAYAMLMLKSACSTPLPDHLVMPPFPPTYNLSKSMMIQTCATSESDSLDYLRQWGIISYDWSNLNGIWHKDHPVRTVSNILAMPSVQEQRFRLLCADGQ